jgi:hypothetical protein
VIEKQYNATENRSVNDRPFPSTVCWRDWAPLVNTLMGSCLVVELNVLAHNTGQMIGIDDNELVQTFVSNGAHPAFGKGIGVWRTHGGADDMNALRPEDVIEVQGELGISVVNEKSNRRITIF